MSLVFSSPPTPSTTSSPYTPQQSSPLAKTPITSMSSPIEAARARRRGQYKPTQAGRNVRPVKWKYSPDDTSRNLLREKFHQKCLERTRKARSNGWDLSSDGFEDDGAGMDEDDDDDDMNDELFRRVMVNEARKRDHRYHVSYEVEVGMSSDPAFQDPSVLEEDFNSGLDDEPAYDDEEELEAYIREYAAQQDSDGDIDFGIPRASSDFRSRPSQDPFTTPQRVHQMASAFPLSS